MERSRQIFAKLGLKGAYSLGHLNSKHMLIRLRDENDFNHLWLREIWYLDGFLMGSFRWSPGFRPVVEPSAAPVWVSWPNLPLFSFNKQALFAIGSLIGKPLSFDAATAKMTRPNVARLCVEVDLLKRLPNRIRLDCETIDGF